MTMSAADFLDQWFETDPLKATMSASGIIGTYQGVRSPGTAYVLLHHYMGEIDGAFRAWGIPKGGTGGISNAIGVGGAGARRRDPDSRRRSPGSSSRTAARPASRSRAARRSRRPTSSRRSTRGGRSSSLLEPGSLDAEFEEEVRRFKFRGSSGKVNLAVDRLPDFTCLPGVGEHLRGAISFSPSLDEMEQAYDDAKYGRFSAQALHRHDHPDARRPVDGAARQARHQLLRPVRAVQAGAGARDLGRPARGVRRRGRSTGSPSSPRTSAT